MQRPKRVLCIMDLDFVGRASLAAALPVLAGCGIQGCPLPASLFSTHTGGFGQVSRRDISDFGMEALAHFSQADIGFDAIYVGYLYKEDQFGLAETAFRQYPQAVRFVDPALGDDGKLYTGVTGEMVERMKDLCAMAHVITPNCTESAWLTGEQPADDAPDEQRMAKRLEILSGTGCSVLITSVSTKDGGHEVIGCGPGGAERYAIPGRYSPGSYPGTGDLFTAALVGLSLKGYATPEAARRAVAFVQAAVRATYDGGGDARHGTWFEPVLPMLAES